MRQKIHFFNLDLKKLLMDRKDKILKLFENIPNKPLVIRIIDEVFLLERKMDELRAMPWIVTHPQNPNITRATPAAKLYKECSQSYMNAVRILIGCLKNEESDAAEKLMELLDKF